MKTLKSFPGGTMASCLSLMAAALLLPATSSKAATWGITDASFFSFFGFSDDWTVFELGNQNVQIQNGSLVGIPVPGQPLQQGAPGGTPGGDIGIGGAAGQNVNLQIQTMSKVANVVVNNGPGIGNIQVQYDNNATVGSTTHRNLNSDIADATNATNYFHGLATTPSGWTSSNPSLSSQLTLGPQNGQLNIAGTNQNLTLTATSATPVVFNIGKFSVDGQATLTLSGAPNDEFVFNIYGGNMSVNNHSNVVLSGGLTPSDVIFNMVGTGGGPQINNGSVASGILISTNQQVQINNQSILHGAVISDGLQLNNQSVIESPDN